MKSILFYILKIISKKIMRKYRPLVIGITGSVGKTSAKDAVYAVLKDNSKVRASSGNFNNEIGLPLTVIGASSGGRSIWAWLKIFQQGIKLIRHEDPNYPDILVLEMGAEHPGDIGYFIDFIPVDIGIVTEVKEVHLEFFGSLEKILQEKFSIFKNFTNDSKIAIVNVDSEIISRNLNKIGGRLITYGFADKADFKASDFKTTQKHNGFGTIFKLSYKGTTIPVYLENMFGRQQVYAAVAALAVANSLNRNLVEAIEHLSTKHFAPKGRTNLIAGVKNTLLIDDTYNSSPTAAVAALTVLDEIAEIKHSRKIAVFGEMLELGSYTEEGHQLVGKKAAEVNVDMLVAVGERSRDIIRGAIKYGLPEAKTFYFAGNQEAGIFVQNKLQAGDTVLIKGSQGARMERVTKELMAEPLRAKELLVRQSGNWLIE